MAQIDRQIGESDSCQDLTETIDRRHPLPCVKQREVTLIRVVKLCEVILIRVVKGREVVLIRVGKPTYCVAAGRAIALAGRR